MMRFCFELSPAADGLLLRDVRIATTFTNNVSIAARCRPPLPLFHFSFAFFASARDDAFADGFAAAAVARFCCHAYCVLLIC